MFLTAATSHGEVYSTLSPPTGQAPVVPPPPPLYDAPTGNLASWDPTLSRFVRRGLFYLVRLLKNGNVVAIEDSGVKQVRSVPPLAPPPAPESSRLAAKINALREGPLSHEDRERLEAEGHDCGVGYYGERIGWIGEWIGDE